MTTTTTISPSPPEPSAPHTSAPAAETRRLLITLIMQLYALEELTTDAAQQRLIERMRTNALDLLACAVDHARDVDHAHRITRAIARREALLEAENLVHGETWTKIHALPRWDGKSRID